MYVIYMYMYIDITSVCVLGFYVCICDVNIRICRVYTYVLRYYVYVRRAKATHKKIKMIDMQTLRVCTCGYFMYVYTWMVRVYSDVTCIYILRVGISCMYRYYAYMYMPVYVYTTHDMLRVNSITRMYGYFVYMYVHVYIYNVHDTLRVYVYTCICI